MRARLPLLLTVAATAALLVYGRIAQPANYHAFADDRMLAGIPHAADVISNIGFAVIGLWGLAALKKSRSVGLDGRGTRGWALFFFSLVLTSIGSAFYHWSPDNTRLVWDRLPLALACAGLLSAVRAEIDPKTNARLWTAALSVAAVASVLWWHLTEQAGRGDLRPYLLLQGLPLVLIPLWQAHARVPRADRSAFAIAIALYVAAKLAELADYQLYAMLAVVSGHTVKHVLATAGAAVLAARFAQRVAADQKSKPEQVMAVR